MGRQFRAPRPGFGSKLVGATIPAASSAIISIPNYGVTDLSTFGAGDFVMDAPSEGVAKTLFYASSSSAAVVVRMSTGTSVKLGHSAATQVTLGLTTADCAVQLIGVNSTRWAVVGVTIMSTLGTQSMSTVPAIAIGTS